MTSINFPLNPTQDQIYEFAGRSWAWNGRSWKSISTFVGFTGSQGIPGEFAAVGFTGSQGDAGYTGSQGIQGDTGFTGSQGVGFTGSSGASAGLTISETTPIGAEVGDLWLDPSDLALYVYYQDQDSNQWIQISNN